MPRQKRIDIPGMFYHVISRGIERRQIFRNDSDRHEFIERLGISLEETQCQCYAWVLMNNHFHLLLRPTKSPLGQTMRKLMSGYVGYFNSRHKRIGSLFQNRYKSILCQEDSYFKELVRYVHLNPVRAGIVKTPSELVKYPWSGHAPILGKKVIPWQDDSTVLKLFCRRPHEAKKLYLRFIKDGWDIGYRKEFMGGGLLRSAGGLSGVQYLRRSNIKWEFDTQILGDGDFVSSVLKNAGVEEDNRSIIQKRYNLNSLSVIVCKQFDITPIDLFSGRRTRSLSLPKGVFVYLGNAFLRESYQSLGSKLKMSSTAAYQLRDRGEEFIKKKGNFLITK